MCILRQSPGVVFLSSPAGLIFIPFPPAFMTCLYDLESTYGPEY